MAYLTKPAAPAQATSRKCGEKGFITNDTTVSWVFTTVAAVAAVAAFHFLKREGLEVLE